MRALLTSLLDLLGFLLLVLALVLLVAPVSTPGAVAVGGLGLLGVSWVVDLAMARRGKT